MKNLVPALLLLSVFACNNPSAEKQTDTGLVFDPALNEKHHMLYTMQVENSLSGDRTDFTMDITCTVSQKKDGKITVLTQYDSVRMQGNISGKAVTLNAATIANQDTTAAAKLAAPVFVYLGKSFETVYNKYHNKISEQQVRAAGDSSLVAAESKVQFAGRYCDTTLRQGFSWFSNERIKMGSNELRDLHYTVSEINDAEVKLDVKGEIQTEGEKFGHEYSMRGKAKGSVVVDRKSGWQKQAAFEIDFTLDMDGKKTPMKQWVKLDEINTHH